MSEHEPNICCSTTREVIGPTMATVPLRIFLNASMSVTQLLDYVQRETGQLNTVKHFGMSKISRINNDTKRACQFQTLLDVHVQEDSAHINLGGPFEETSAASVSATDSPQVARFFSTYALKVQCVVGDSGLDCLMTFDSNILSAERVRRMCHQFEHVLRQLCEPTNATKCLADVDFVSRQDLQDINAWNATVPATEQTCVHDTIAQTARRQPSAQAVCAWDGELNYEALEKLSTRLAHHLCTIGIKDLVIPLYFEKSMWTSVAILGVMKAGGACVTLDSTQPEAHLKRVAQQVSGKVILSSVRNRELAEQLVGSAGQVVVPEQILPLLSDHVYSAQSTREAGLPKIRPSDKLYVVFTSGSTGMPKGVVVTHANFSSAAHYQQDLLGISTASRVYDYVSYAFDVSWLNTLLTLISGACLCVPSEEDRKGDIATSMEQLHVTHADLTPSITRIIEPADVPSLRHLNFGGEAVLAQDVARWTTGPDIVVVNTYGPAECTPKSTAYNYTRGGSKTANLIGKGVGLNTWVVEPENSDRLAIIGGVGELWLEGPLVADGYLGEPEKTASAFIEDPPWLPGRQGRLYRTGDLVRYNTDGSLTYIKRKDGQVKIRGQRVELADIEHHILDALDHKVLAKDVNVVAELVAPLGSDNQALVAFMAMSGAGDQDYQAQLTRLVHTMEERLRERVPAYMIPNAYVALPVIPMGPTGKTDRRQLKDIGKNMTLEDLATCNLARKKQAQARTPTTAAEQQLRSLWATTLGLEPTSIGLDDSFFQIGGDSIAAMRLVAAARAQGLALKVSDVFEQPHLEDLSSLITSHENTMCKNHPSEDRDRLSRLSFHFTPDVLLQLRSLLTPSSDVLPVTNFQSLCIQGALKDPKLWWDYRYLDFPEQTDIKTLLHCCQSIWDRFDILRMVFMRSGDRYFQVVPRKSELALVIRETANDLDNDFTQMCKADEAIPVLLGTCFTKFFITRSTAGPSRLTFRLSHAQYDDVSYRVIMRSLQAAFDGIQLPSAPNFANFLQRGVSRGVDTFKYWKSILDGATMTRVPASQSKSKSGQGIEATITTTIPSSTYGMTPATIFTAACACALAKVANISEVTFGRVVSGRSALNLDLQEVVGACVGLVPVRIAFDRVPSMRTAEAAVQHQYVKGMGYETIGLASDMDIEISKAETALTDFGCFVHFQNGDLDPVEHIGGHLRRLKSYEWQDVRVDTKVDRVDVLARPVGKSLSITVTSGKHKLVELEAFLQEICNALGARS